MKNIIIFIATIFCFTASSLAYDIEFSSLPVEESTMADIVSVQELDLLENGATVSIITTTLGPKTDFGDQYTNYLVYSIKGELKHISAVFNIGDSIRVPKISQPNANSNSNYLYFDSYNSSEDDMVETAALFFNYSKIIMDTEKSHTEEFEKNILDTTLTIDKKVIPDVRPWEDTDTMPKNEVTHKKNFWDWFNIDFDRNK